VSARRRRRRRARNQNRVGREEEGIGLDERNEAYERGKQDRGNGVELAENPYTEDERDATAWRDGWLDYDDVRTVEVDNFIGA